MWECDSAADVDADVVDGILSDPRSINRMKASPIGRLEKEELYRDGNILEPR